MTEGVLSSAGSGFIQHFPGRFHGNYSELELFFIVHDNTWSIFLTRNTFAEVVESQLFQKMKSGGMFIN